MKIQTFNRAQVLLQQAAEIGEQRRRLGRIRPKTLRLYDGCETISVGDFSPELAQTVIDIVKSDFDRQAKRLEDEFAALQDKPDRPECPQPCI